MNRTVAIQGFQASFHEVATERFFGDGYKPLHCPNFAQMFAAVKKGKAAYAVCAFENSLAGSILPNYALLRNSNLEVFGEVYLCIEMNLMALPGTKVEELEEIHAHPMALLQCQEFLGKYPHIQLVESKDTALPASEIRDHHIRHRGAIAGKQAAETFGLEIIAADIHDNKRNFTRFLALRNRGTEPPVGNIDKASLSFRASHTPGSLAKILTIIGEHGINMNKIQSLPVIGEEWKYYFYVDLRFDDADAYRRMMKEAEPLMHDLRVLGEYRQGARPV